MKKYSYGQKCDEIRFLNIPRTEENSLLSQDFQIYGILSLPIPFSSS